jgi:hypothetical protein
MRRRLLFLLAGLGASAAAIVLLPGTAHALAPASSARPAPPPVHLSIPKPPDVVAVKTVATRVVHQVKQIPQVGEVAQVVAAVPVVVGRVTVPLVTPAMEAVALRSLPIARDRAPNDLRISMSTRPSRLGHALASAVASAPHATHRTRKTRTRRPSNGSSLLFVLPGLSDNAMSPARSSVGSPFASIETRAPRVTTRSCWLTFPTADRTRPGFLAGSARPG